MPVGKSGGETSATGYTRRSPVAVFSDAGSIPAASTILKKTASLRAVRLYISPSITHRLPHLFAQITSFIKLAKLTSFVSGLVVGIGSQSHLSISRMRLSI